MQLPQAPPLGRPGLRRLPVAPCAAQTDGKASGGGNRKPASWSSRGRQSTPARTAAPPQPKPQQQPQRLRLFGPDSSAPPAGGGEDDEPVSRRLADEEDDGGSRGPMRAPGGEDLESAASSSGRDSPPSASPSQRRKMVLDIHRQALADAGLEKVNAQLGLIVVVFILPASLATRVCRPGIPYGKPRANRKHTVPVIACLQSKTELELTRLYSFRAAVKNAPKDAAQKKALQVRCACTWVAGGWGCAGHNSTWLSMIW